MKLSCQRWHPKEEFQIPNFSSAEKKKIVELSTNSRLVLINEIRKTHGISLRDAKFSLMHINPIYQECHRCKKQLDSKENTTCTKCGALNFNWNVYS